MILIYPPLVEAAGFPPAEIKFSRTAQCFLIASNLRRTANFLNYDLVVAEAQSLHANDRLQESDLYCFQIIRDP